MCIQALRNFSTKQVLVLLFGAKSHVESVELWVLFSKNNRLDVVLRQPMLRDRYTPINLFEIVPVLGMRTDRILMRLDAGEWRIWWRWCMLEQCIRVLTVTRPDIKSKMG